MRITTTSIQRNSLGNINKLQGRLADLQAQMATGKRVDKISDDPIASAQILRSSQEIHAIDTYQRSGDHARNQMQMSEGIIGQYIDVLHRVKELSIQAGNVGILSPQDRQSIAVELEQRKQQILNFANYQDSNGEYLFSGYQALTRPFALNENGGYAYYGDDGEQLVEIGPGSKLAINVTGTDLFDRVPASPDSYLIEVGENNLGNFNTSLGKINDLTAWQTSVASNESYTLTFNPPAGNTFDVEADSNPGTPLPGLNNVPYISGNEVTIAGITFTLSGTPQPGDTLNLSVPTEQNIFTSIDKFIKTLNSENDSTRLNHGAQQMIGNVNSALDTANLERTKLGAKLNVVTTQQDTNDQLSYANQVIESKLRDLDYPEAISDISQFSFALEASQKSFLKTQGLSLFNFI